MDHWVLVDDTSHTIVYDHPEGSAWTSITATDNDGLHPPDAFIFQNTLHVGTGNVSLSYKFSGTAVEIGGFSRHLYADSAVPTKLVCLIDGEPAFIESGTDSTLFSHDYCVASSLSPGEHTVLLAAKVNYNTTFLLDRVRYIPLEGANPDSLLMGYNQTDKSITYQGGWQERDGVKVSTGMPGTLATVDFNGTSLQWIGALLPGFTHSELKVVYTLDDGPKHIISIRDIQNPDLDYPAIYDRVVFDTGPIPSGKHQLRVIPDNQDIGSTIPLTLRYLVVQNMPSNSGSPISNLTTGSNPPVIASSAQWTGLSTAAIAGIAVGSAVVVMLVVAIVVLRTRPSARNALRKLPMSQSVAPFFHLGSQSSRLTSIEHSEKVITSGAPTQDFKSRSNIYMTTRSTILPELTEKSSPYSQQLSSTILNTSQAPASLLSLHLSSIRTEVWEGYVSSHGMSIAREPEEPPSYAETWQSSR